MGTMRNGGHRYGVSTTKQLWYKYVSHGSYFYTYFGNFSSQCSNNWKILFDGLKSSCVHKWLKIDSTNGLALMQIHREIYIDIDKIIDQFVKNKNWRLYFYCNIKFVVIYIFFILVNLIKIKFFLMDATKYIIFKCTYIIKIFALKYLLKLI